MIKIKNYKKVENLEEAWELNQKRTNRIRINMANQNTELVKLGKDE